MNRQVDIKALVSHIVRGDGLDKCRICMGDTSQGQVHLGDTVMMDGDKAVTLSELLQVITGVEVVSQEGLPPAICIQCSSSVTQAANFRNLVQKAEQEWNNTLQLLEHVPEYTILSKTTNGLIVSIQRDNIYIVEECMNNSVNQTTTKSVPKAVKAKIVQNVTSKTKYSSNHKCPKCGMKFLYPRQLYTHLNQSADSIRACHLCGKIMTRDELVEHLKIKHKKVPLSCKKCPAMFLYSKQYREHLLKAHVPGASTCGDCGRSFASQAAFNAHHSVHSQRSCPNCDTQFINQTCYVYHLKKCCDIKNAEKDTKSKITVTLNNKQNKKVKLGVRGSRNKECICDYCKKKFAGKKFVATHIQIVHTKETHKPCICCGKLFAAAHMPTHMKSHSVESYECGECGVTVKSKLGFSQHLRLHTGERPYPCQFCGERFSASSRRSEHIRNTHKKSEIVLKQVCKMCPARFRLPHKLRHHMKTVHGEGVKDSMYECKECKEKFASCRSLLYHARKHIKTP